MLRTHKIRLNPTPEQEVYLKKAVGTCRFSFNWALARWLELKSQGVENCGPMALQKEFNAIKGIEFPWAYDVTKSASESGFRRLQTAMKNYYDYKNGKRKGNRVGFPKFKSRKNNKQSFTMTSDRFKINGNWLTMNKLYSWINITEPLRYDGKIKSATISSKAGRWYISILVEVPDPEPSNHSIETVGIDLGLKTLATLSDGTEFENQKFLRSELNKLKRLNRTLARRKQGSDRWKKAKLKLARFHEKATNRRKDYSHKITRQIANTYEFVGVEDLNLTGLVQNRKLSLSFSDAGLGEFVRQLDYKTAETGGVMVKVGRFYASSKTCFDCGFVNKELELSDRKWTCLGCGVVHNRDWNASKNIEKEAIRLYNGSFGDGYVECKSSWTECQSPLGAVLDEARTFGNYLPKR